MTKSYDVAIIGGAGLAMSGKVQGVAKRLGRVATLGDRGKVRDGTGGHMIHVMDCNQNASKGGEAELFGGIAGGVKKLTAEPCFFPA